MTHKPRLNVVKPNSASPQPPRPLGKHGSALWRHVQRDHRIDNVGGRELLAQACAALDRAEALREVIDKDGEMLCSPRGEIKDHPGLKHELASRAFVTRTLVRLGLTTEQIRPLGRPASACSVTWRQLQEPWNADAKADEPEGDGA